jgi:hypothetical protein
MAKLHPDSEIIGPMAEIAAIFQGRTAPPPGVTRRIRLPVGASDRALSPKSPDHAVPVIMAGIGEK